MCDRRQGLYGEADVEHLPRRAQVYAPQWFQRLDCSFAQLFASRAFPSSALFRAAGRRRHYAAKPSHLGIDGGLGRTELVDTIAGRSRKRHPPERSFHEIAAAPLVIRARSEIHGNG
jgi:hypothetical protein